MILNNDTNKRILADINQCINWKQSTNETVADLFLGSGSTIIACIQTKRNCIGIELDPIYMQAIIDRIKQFLEKNNIEYEFIKH